MLKTEQNTDTMQKRVETAARKRFRRRKGVHAFFEHGQWWVDTEDGDYTYSVVDAEGGFSVDGFDFELISERTD